MIIQKKPIGKAVKDEIDISEEKQQVKNAAKEEVLMPEEKKQAVKEIQTCDVKKGIKTVAGTAAGSSIGIVGAVTMVAVLAAEHIILPVAVCVWAFAIAGGAIGMSLGLGKDKKGKTPKEG